MKRLNFLLFNLLVIVGFQVISFASTLNSGDISEKEITDLKSEIIDLLKNKNPSSDFNITETGVDYTNYNQLDRRLITLSNLKQAIEKTVVLKDFKGTVFIHLVYPHPNFYRQTALQSDYSFNSQNITFFTGYYLDSLLPFESMIPFFSAEAKFDPQFQRFLARNADRNEEILYEYFNETASYFKAAIDLALSESFVNSNYNVAEKIFKKHVKTKKKFLLFEGNVMDNYELNVDHLNKYPNANFELLNSQYSMEILKYDDYFEISLRTNNNKFSIFLSIDGYITGIFDGYID